MNIRLRVVCLAQLVLLAAAGAATGQSLPPVASEEAVERHGVATRPFEDPGPRDLVAYPFRAGSGRDADTVVGALASVRPEDRKSVV